MLTRSAILFVSFVLSAGLIDRAGESEPRPLARPFEIFPMQLDDWRGRQQAAFDDKTLAILGVSDYLTRSYFRPEAAAGLYVGYWASQRQGDTIHSPLNCLPGSGWEPLSKREMDVAVPDQIGGTRSRRVVVNRYVVEKGLDRQLVLYWYQSHGRVVASEYVSKMYLVTDAIRLRRTDAAIVRVMVPVKPGDAGEQNAERQGAQFIESLFPALAHYLPS